MLSSSGIGLEARKRNSDDAHYLAELRNTVKLRSVIVGWLVRLGTVDEPPAPEAAEPSFNPAISVRAFDPATGTETGDEG